MKELPHTPTLPEAPEIQPARDSRVRGTQSLVHTLGRCWRRPSLTALEVLWRWAFGIPTLLLAWHFAQRIANETGLDLAAFERLSPTDPMATAESLSRIFTLLLPPIERLALWLTPLLLLAWIVLSSLGRTIVLRRADPTLHSRIPTLIGLAAIRVTALTGAIALWLLTVHQAAALAITAPIAAGEEPNLVLYFALLIVATLGLFVAWAVASWALGVAPLLAMLHRSGVVASLAAAFRLGPMKPRLIEINLVMGIVKIMLIVLALVLSSTPLPFESVATPQFLTDWWIGTTLLYFIASDFFHVARFAAYLELWRAFKGS